MRDVVGGGGGKQLEGVAAAFLPARDADDAPLDRLAGAILDGGALPGGYPAQGREAAARRKVSKQDEKKAFFLVRENAKKKEV